MERNERLIQEINHHFLTHGDPSRLSPFRKGYDSIVLYGSAFAGKTFIVTENEEMGRAVGIRLELKPNQGGVDAITNYYDVPGLDIRSTVFVGGNKIVDNVPIRELATYIPIAVEYNSKIEIQVEASIITGSGIVTLENALVFIPVILYSRHHLSFVKNPSLLTKTT